MIPATQMFECFMPVLYVTNARRHCSFILFCSMLMEIWFGEVTRSCPFILVIPQRHFYVIGFQDASFTSKWSNLEKIWNNHMLCQLEHSQEECSSVWGWLLHGRSLLNLKSLVFKLVEYWNFTVWSWHLVIRCLEWISIHLAWFHSCYWYSCFYKMLTDNRICSPKFLHFVLLLLTES